MNPESAARFLVTVFFAVVFLQSAGDKILDREGNLGFLRDHFKSSPIPVELVPILFWTLTALEALAGVLCGLGILFSDFRREGSSLASWGVFVAGIALVSLITGQRLAKDYAGAAVVAAYFAVAIIGLSAFD
jgi:hypothetical protein